MIRIGTVAIQQRRRLPEDVILIDATVKSGEPNLAPTWELVWGSKKHHKKEEGGICDDEYLKAYRLILRKRVLEDREWFKNFLMEHDGKTIVIGCYCPYGTFCHRYYLSEVLAKLAKWFGIEVELLDEFCKDKK